MSELKEKLLIKLEDEDGIYGMIAISSKVSINQIEEAIEEYIEWEKNNRDEGYNIDGFYLWLKEFTKLEFEIINIEDAISIYF